MELTRRAAIALALAAAAVPVSAARRMVDSSAGFLAVDEVARGLENPWSVAFLPDGRQIVTERSGRLRLIDGGAVSEPVAGVPEVFASGQGGLFDVALAPDFAQSRRLWLSYAEPVDGGAVTALARGRLGDGGLEEMRVIFRMNRPSRGGRHFGGRIVLRGDGSLFLTTGDRGQPDRAQDLRDHAGKVLRLALDGSAPGDNPFQGRADALPEIWSCGHRNPQGAALDAEGRLWTVEHGAAGGDELNRPEAGRNYGWPVISYGRHYSGGRIGEGVAKEGMEQPLHHWDPSIAPSGLVIYRGDLIPQWRGSAVAGALKYQLLSRIELGADGAGPEERVFDGEFGRIRDVREGPDGALWFLTDERDGGLYRLAPAR